MCCNIQGSNIPVYTCIIKGSTSLKYNTKSREHYKQKRLQEKQSEYFTAIKTQH